MKRKKKTIKDFVFKYLHKTWHRDAVVFADVADKVRKAFPESKFNPNHLSVYITRFKWHIDNGTKTW